jgi:hypothetical protein
LIFIGIARGVADSALKVAFIGSGADLASGWINRNIWLNKEVYLLIMFKFKTG